MANHNHAHPHSLLEGVPGPVLGSAALLPRGQLQPGVELHEDNPREAAEEDLLDEGGNLGASEAAEVDIQRDYSHGAREGDQANGHAVVHR